MSIPKDHLYTEDHEWFDPATGCVGITDHAQAELGDIVFVELPEVGAAYKKGDRLAVIESVKAVADVFAPVSLTVTEVNTELEDAPEKLNEAADETFIAKVELADESEKALLMDADAYKALVGEE